MRRCCRLQRTLRAIHQQPVWYEFERDEHLHARILCRPCFDCRCCCCRHVTICAHWTVVGTNAPGVSHCPTASGNDATLVGDRVPVSDRASVDAEIGCQSAGRLSSEAMLLRKLAASDIHLDKKFTTLNHLVARYTPISRFPRYLYAIEEQRCGTTTENLVGKLATTATYSFKATQILHPIYDSRRREQSPRGSRQGIDSHNRIEQNCKQAARISTKRTCWKAGFPNPRFQCGYP